MIASGEQQRYSTVHIHVSILPQTYLPCRLPHNIQQSSLCYTVDPCWSSTLNTAVCTENHKFLLYVCEDCPMFPLQRKIQNIKEATTYLAAVVNIFISETKFLLEDVDFKWILKIYFLLVLLIP